MDIVVQKATELGAHRISPVLMDFSVVKLNAARAAKRAAHWAKIAASACEQSGRNELPLIDEPKPLHESLAAATDKDETRIFLDPAAAKPLSNIEQPAGSLTVLVGPEGGLSDNEKEQTQCAGFAAVSLGPRILRTETAAVAAITALQVLFGDLGGQLRY